jgi:hypothetical protein
LDTNELREYILSYTMPEMLDIEMAKRNVLEHLSSQPIGHMEKSEILIRRACPTVFAEKGPIPPGFMSITPDLNYVKGEAIACEAIQLLHTSGALVASGPLIRGGRILLETDTTQVSFQATYSHGSGTPRICTVSLPAVYYEYRLSTAFQRQNARLASGDVFLSRLDQTQLHSRAKRCIRESIDAFKVGLYLSASMSIGAASESLWMKLALLLASKPDIQATSDGAKLAKMLEKSPQIGEVIETTWKLITNHRLTQRNKVLPTVPDRTIFENQTERLRSRRNYAIHDENADDAEPLFTYNETGMLLSASEDYFKNLISLIQEMA